MGPSRWITWGSQDSVPPESPRPMDVTYSHLPLLEDGGPPWLKIMPKAQMNQVTKKIILASLGIGLQLSSWQTDLQGQILT